MNYTKKPANEFAEAMETKRTNIADAQKRKNDAIQIAGLQRDATILTAARVQNSRAEWDAEEIETEWQKWHDFLQAKLDKQILGF
jgi:hypothetical protein